MAISSWPAAERPRERLLAKGAASLSDAELLAIFLRTGIPGKSAVDLARELLADFGGLRGLLLASQQDFCARPGLGPAKFAQLQACLEMTSRHLAAHWERGEVLESPAQVSRYLQSLLRDREREVFYVLFLDQRHRVLRGEELFQGTIHSTHVHLREIAKRALALNAAAIIVAHNHPSGVAEPSVADRALTRQLEDVLGHLDIHLLDHFVIGDGVPVSLREHGGW